MSKILLSIHERYAIDIMLGRKKWEFRRRLPYLSLKSPLETILFYVTKPEGGFVAFGANVDRLYRYPSDELNALWWVVEHDSPGLSRDEFFRYFKGCKEAFGVRLCNVEFLGDADVTLPLAGGRSGYIEYGLPLSFFGVKRAPQNFCYISNKKETLQ